MSFADLRSKVPFTTNDRVYWDNCRKFKELLREVPINVQISLVMFSTDVVDLLFLRLEQMLNQSCVLSHFLAAYCFQIP